ncbi:GH17976 [Drosophila grimshawi]|uniref:GH17976 n=1 Tax=Drosophila grimshawi TaxID=7222 RepID=B4K0E6_DROGR|nr:GH17976 [Drosophila grimshawi]
MAVYTTGMLYQNLTRCKTIPLIVECHVAATLFDRKTRLLPRKANVTRFRQRLKQLVNLNMELSSPADIDYAAE